MPFPVDLEKELNEFNPKINSVTAAIRGHSIRGAAVVRPVSTLTQDPKFNLTPQQRRQGFLYLYSGLTKARKSTWTWMALATQALFPGLPQKPISLADEKKFKPLLQEHGKAWTSASASLLTSVRKNEEGKNVWIKIPLMVFNNEKGTSDIKGVFISTGLCLKKEPGSEDPFSTLDKSLAQNARLEAGIEVKVADLPAPTAGSSLDARDVQALIDCNSSVSIVRRGFYDLLYLTLEIPQSQAEYLVNTEWMAIRPLDVYGPIFEWVDSQFGRLGKAPAFSIPLKKISKSLEGIHGTLKPRVSEDGVLVDEHGALYWMPENLSDINRFEDAMNAAYRQSDGTFTAIPADGKPLTPPPSMPVLVDWVNLKFSFTTLTGRLNIKNLDRTYVATATHYWRFVDKRLSSDLVKNFLSMIAQMALFYGLPTINTRNFVADVMKVAARRDAYRDETEVPLWEIQNYAKSKPGEEFDQADPACLQFVETATEVLKKVIASPDTAYTRYSVLNVLQLRAQLVAFVKHCDVPSDLKKADLQLRSSYIDQDPDPNYKLTPVPYVQDSLGFMPHQVKVANVTRNRPPQIFYPVQAGGGKTLMGIYDILRELSAGEKGPFVVMCPAHLVPQYVKELVYSTKGRMNCIPITTYTIRRQGFDRLRAMIEASPINTVLIVDYNVIDLGSKTLSYGVAPVKVFPVIEFVRQFSPQYVFCDEAHYLRNESSRQSATNRLIADIPKKRLASGTLVTNTILDLARQMALMDPTVFGTTEDFVNEYALETRGSKVLAWKPRAELMVRRQMLENSIVAEAQRKEWAAILPYPKERFHSSDLSAEQMKVYKEILLQTQDEIQKQSQENEALRQLFNPNPDDENFDEVVGNIDSLLKPFLARLERFLDAPGKDPLGKVMLTGNDLVSSKALKVVDLCREHLEQNIPGKVLIFTNYVFSAEAIFEAFPPELQKHVIYYTADRKEECGSEFENNPEKKIMVGIEFSMNTGLNLQYCSRLIRVNTVWTPGVLEQGDSRIGRPNLKERETRPYVYYDWIVANRTIDVTKISYLMSKTISKAKFDEAGNPRFDGLEVPPLFSMNLDVIAEMNDFNESLRDYFDKYQAYKKALFAEYAEYREKNKDLLFNSDGTLKLAKVEKSESPEGSKLMVRVPYVPGMELYSADKLGLVRYDAFMRLNVEDGDSEEETDSEDEEDGKVDPGLEAERKAALGMSVHTDRGDGVITRVNKTTLQVELPSGDKIKVRKLASFIITRAETSNKDVRLQLLKMTGEVPIDAPVDVLETGLNARKKLVEKKQKQEVVEEAPPTVSLEFTVVNDFLGLRVTEFEDERVSSILQTVGFRFSPSYYAAAIPTAQHLLTLAKKWQEQGFELDKENALWLRGVYNHMKASKKAAPNFFGVANSADIKNFYRTEFKANPNSMKINPYPLIQDGVLYVALPERGQPGSKNAMRMARVPGIKWFEYAAGSELLAFTPSKARASQVIQKLLSLGLSIDNLEKLKKQFSKLRIARDQEV